VGFEENDIAGVERIIASAIAPAFLLTGLFGLLNVLSARLGRVIDRERAIREKRGTPMEGEGPRLAWRARNLHRAISCCVLAAILLCGLIVWSFVGAFVGLPLARLLAGLLVGAMLALILALMLFLREVRLASTHLPLEAEGEDEDDD
jgi:MFS family permease